MALVAPSLLAADFGRLGEALEIIKRAGAPIVHIDVMDGHFAPDISVGQPVIRSLRRATNLVLDVHLLIERPERFVAEFADAGADRIAVHVESTHHLLKVLAIIRAHGAKAGVALSPATPIPMLKDLMGDIEFLNVLTAEPKLNEDVFHSSLVDKVRQAAQARGRQQFDIQVEGGVGFEHVPELVRAGADILVAGSAIFHNGNSGAKLSEMIRLAAGTRQTSTV